MVKTTKIENTTYILAAVALLFTLWARMVPVVVAGTIAFSIACFLSEKLSKKLPSSYAKTIAAAFISIFVAGLLTAVAFVTIKFFRDNGLDQMFAMVMDTINQSKDKIPKQWLDDVPQNTDEIRDFVVNWIQDNSGHLTNVTESTLHAGVQIIVGIIIGVAAAFASSTTEVKSKKPLAKAMHDRLHTYLFSFNAFISAQLKIAIFNSTMTAIYIGLILPVFDVKLPYFKTMVVVTFLFSLLPIVGNILSNALMVTISLGTSVGVAVASLFYLILIHKAEWFISARIISNTVESNIYEILATIVILERLFGVGGLAFAPIVYAYVKTELRKLDLV